MGIQTIAYLIFGKLLIYFGMKVFGGSKFYPTRLVFSCDECLGVWVYTILSFVMGEVIFPQFYHIVFSEFTTGLFYSFLVHLTTLGWKSKFENIFIK